VRIKFEINTYCEYHEEKLNCCGGPCMINVGMNSLLILGDEFNSLYVHFGQIYEFVKFTLGLLNTLSPF
jgi:hypothetical protein